MKWITLAACAFVVVVCVAASQPVESLHAQTPAASSAAAHRPADVESFRKTIEPIFMKDRGGTMPGYAACVMCHTWQTSLRFDLETPASDAGWTPDQSRMNFAMITQLVNTRSPENSYLLAKPLEPKAGGLGHTGGTYWTSRSDPEYQAVLAWIKSLPADRYVPPPAPPVDFEFFRSCVQKVFATPREGHINCSNCHGGGQIGFAPVPGDGRTHVERRGGPSGVRRDRAAHRRRQSRAESFLVEAASSGRWRVVRAQRSAALADARRSRVADAGGMGPRRAQGQQLLVMAVHAHVRR